MTRTAARAAVFYSGSAIEFRFGAVRNNNSRYTGDSLRGLP